MLGIEKHLGRNEFYDRMKQNYDICMQAQGIHGMILCETYYETYGKKMILEKFPTYSTQIAVGLVGEGSDCFWFYDVVSRDMGNVAKL